MRRDVCVRGAVQHSCTATQQAAMACDCTGYRPAETVLDGAAATCSPARPAAGTCGRTRPAAHTAGGEHVLNLRGRTNSKVSRRWLSITHADVMLSCADWRGQVVQRKQQGLSSSIAGRCAGSCARCSTGLARQRAVECTQGRGTAPCCSDIGWCAAGYRQRGSFRRVHDHGHRRAGPLRAGHTASSRAQLELRAGHIFFYSFFRRQPSSGQPPEPAGGAHPWYNRPASTSRRAHRSRRVTVSAG